jgi:hypothetical protein
MSHSLTCYHCSSIISPGELIKIDLAGISRLFCCPGCMAIAKAIAKGSATMPTVNPAKTSFVNKVLL